jgi:DNA gyrase subunit B
MWQEFFGRLDSAPAYPPRQEDALDWLDDSYRILYGDKPIPADYCGNLELYAFRCACKYLEVQVNRNGISRTLRFERGENIGGISSLPTEEANGTCFRFEPDPEVFTETVLPEGFFTEKLEAFSIQIPGFTCTYENAEGQARTCCYPEGAKSYIEMQHPGSVYRTIMWAKGRERYNSAEYKAHVELAIGYTPDAGTVRCYHNLDLLPFGGSHLKELKKRFCNAIRSCCGGGQKLTFSKMEKHLTLILSTRCAPQFTVWANGSRKAIENRLLTDMAQDAIDEAFERYLHEYKAVYRGLVDAALKGRNEQ